MQALVQLKEDHLQLLGGNPAGRDQLHETISTWAGWRRRPAAARLPGGERSCSLYTARPWESTIIPLLEQTQIELLWEDHAVQRYLQHRVQGVDRAKLELDPPPSHHAPLDWDDEWARTPMPHQVQAIRALKCMGYRAILSDDMGLGKSASALWTWQQSGMPRALIVCPKTVKRNWVREIRKTLNECDVFVIDGTSRQRADAFAQLQWWLKQDVGSRKAVIINYDLLHSLPDHHTQILVQWVLEQFLILDESHYVKSKKAQRTKFVFEHLAPSRGGALGRLALTGTPIRNTLEDLWAQVQIIRPGVWTSFHQFDKFHLVRSKMEVETGVDKKGVVRMKTLSPVRASKNTEQLNAVINTLQVRRMKEDVLDLPPKTFTFTEFELDPATAKIYKAMREFALIELADLGDDTPVFAPHAQSALEVTLRLEQIAQGFLGGIPERYLEQVTPMLKGAVKIKDRPGHLIFPKAAKIQWLTETIDSIILQGGRPVVFSRFNTPMFWLAEQWEDSAVLHGGMSMAQRDDTLERFQNKGIAALFCQVKIAEGWNATASQDCIFYGRDWSPAINAQAADRLHRLGQTGTVNVQVPIVINTFESYLHKKLAAKEADAEQALKQVTVGELRKAL